MNEEQGRTSMIASAMASAVAANAESAEAKTNLVDQIRAESQGASEDILRRKPNKNTPFEELKAYITAKVKYTYQVFMARQTKITEKHMDRLHQYMQPALNDLVTIGVLKRINAVCDWRVNTKMSIADNDLVCLVIYETPSGSVITVTVCQNPVHSRIDALQVSKQMPGIRRI